MQSFPPELGEHLARISALDPQQIERLLREIGEYFQEDLPTFVRRRHGELQRAGWTNERIWPQLCEELDQGLFRSPGHSHRQLRRMVYG